MDMTLSIATICQDEEDLMPIYFACCKYLSDNLGDDLKEIVVVDGGSRDHTVDIAISWLKHIPLIFLQNPFDSFGQQKNRALEHVTGDFVLGLDADMTVSKNFVDVFKSGWFDDKKFVDFPMLFTTYDAYHYFHKWTRGVNMRLWKRGPKFRTNFHEKLEGQPLTGLPICSNVYIFEHSCRASDNALINRGERYQKFVKEMAEQGSSPGPPDRYIKAKQSTEYISLPDNIKDLVIEGT